MRAQMKTISLKIEQELHAVLPELSRLNAHKPISEVIRRLLWQEVDRLGLGKRSQARPVGRRHRYST